MMMGETLHGVPPGELLHVSDPRQEQLEHQIQHTATITAEIWCFSPPLFPGGAPAGLDPAYESCSETRA